MLLHFVNFLVRNLYYVLYHFTTLTLLRSCHEIFLTNRKNQLIYVQNFLGIGRTRGEVESNPWHSDQHATSAP